MKLRPDYYAGLTYHALPNSEYGMLVTMDNTYAAPVVEGFVFFNEADLPEESLIRQRCERLSQQLTQDRLAYERFVRTKGRRPNFDIYACFQPFNEAFKAFFPFIPALQKQLPADGIILNLWDRTGYNAALLAGLFPQQKVINIWEGNKDTLGYKGFDFWYQSTSGEVQIAFADLNAPLPFADNSISLVLGLDTLHRFDQAVLLRELFRVVTPEGSILFPHVHLTNNEPEPFFERGCLQLHGTIYDRFFAQMTQGNNRRGYLLPEPEMFLYNELSNEGPKAVYSQPNSHHYNTSVAILPENWAEQHQLHSFRFDQLTAPEQCRILLNPLLEIDWSHQLVRQNPAYLSDRVGYLLARHPVYLQKLIEEEPLSDMEIKLLYWAPRLLTVVEIAERIKAPLAEVLASLKRLQAGDVLQLVPLTEDQLRLQYFVSTQQYRLPDNQQNIQALWQRAVTHFADQPFIISVADETEITYAEANELLTLIRNALYTQGVRAGSRVVHLTNKHFEGVLTVLASMQLGAVAVPIDHEAAPELIQSILANTGPQLVFSDQQHLNWLRDTEWEVIQLDNEEETDGIPLFSDWLEENGEASVPLPTLSPSTLACLLYTSGSTGTPKGVQLTHGQLVRSARLISENFGWLGTDRFFSPGELDSMSGFRNHCLAPLEVGAAIILPPPGLQSHLFALTEVMERYQATLLGTTPALLNQLVQYPKRVRPGLRNLRVVMCTGSHLPPSLRQRFADAFGLPPLNYYGLTETTGICTTETTDSHQANHSTIGQACGAIAQVVNDQGKPLPYGTEGHLRIYSENITTGYYRDLERTAHLIQNGWLYTGDTACLEPNGHISLLGRSRDIIKLPSGQLVFASAIENVLLSAPEWVLAAAVTSYENEGLEQMVAFVVTPTVDTVACRTALSSLINEQLGSRQVPAHWVFVDKLPLTANGKVRKKQLIKDHF